MARCPCEIKMNIRRLQKHWVDDIRPEKSGYQPEIGMGGNCWVRRTSRGGWQRAGEEEEKKYSANADMIQNMNID